MTRPADDRTHRRRRRDDQADRQVGDAGHHALDHGDVVRRELVELGRDAVVHGPAHARADDEEGAEAQLGRRRPRQHGAAGDHERGAGGHPRADVLVEHGRRQEHGGDQLEVEEQRGGGCGGAGESRGEQHRRDRAADDDGHGQPTAASPQRPDRGRAAQRCGQHGEGGADVEQAAEGEGVHLARELRRRRRRRAEQDRRDHATDDRRAIHGPRMPDLVSAARLRLTANIVDDHEVVGSAE